MEIVWTAAHVDQYLAGEDRPFSAMFSAYRPAMESCYSGLNLNYTSPEEDHPILGGRFMEAFAGDHYRH